MDSIINNNGKGFRIIPSLDSFDDTEIINPDKQTLKRIERFRKTVSYAILKELETRVRRGDPVAINTVNFNKESRRDWLKYGLISYVIHNQDNQTKKELDDAQKEIEKNRRYYNVRYYIDEQTGAPVIVSSDAPKTPLNRSTSAMFS